MGIVSSFLRLFTIHSVSQNTKHRAQTQSKTCTQIDRERERDRTDNAHIFMRNNLSRLLFFSLFDSTSFLWYHKYWVQKVKQQQNSYFWRKKINKNNKIILFGVVKSARNESYVFICFFCLKLCPTQENSISVSFSVHSILFVLSFYSRIQFHSVAIVVIVWCCCQHYYYVLYCLFRLFTHCSHCATVNRIFWSQGFIIRIVFENERCWNAFGSRVFSWYHYSILYDYKI